MALGFTPALARTTSRPRVPANLRRADVGYTRTPPERREFVNDTRRAYSRIIVRGPDPFWLGMVATPEAQEQERLRVQVFETPGDHVYIAALDGPDRAYIRFDSSTAAPIELRRGMRIERAFDRITFEFHVTAKTDNGNPAAWWPSRRPPMRVVAFVSFGDMIVEHGSIDSFGYEPGFVCGRDAVTEANGPQFIWQRMLDFGLWFPGIPGILPSLIIEAGLVTIQPLIGGTAAVPLYVKYGEISDNVIADTPNFNPGGIDPRTAFWWELRTEMLEISSAGTTNRVPICEKLELPISARMTLRDGAVSAAGDPFSGQAQGDPIGILVCSTVPGSVVHYQWMVSKMKIVGFDDTEEVV